MSINPTHIPFLKVPTDTYPYILSWSSHKLTQNHTSNCPNAKLGRSRTGAPDCATSYGACPLLGTTPCGSLGYHALKEMLLIDAIGLEFPAGLVDTEDGSPAVTAAREMKEETGFEVTVPRRFLGGVTAPAKPTTTAPTSEEDGDCDSDACVENVSGTPMSYDPGLTDSPFHLGYDSDLALW